MDSFLTLPLLSDSLLVFPTTPEAKELEQVCEISDRLGCLKVEKAGITKFFCQAAKVYCYETRGNEIVIKAKGFSLFEKLLIDNGQANLIENNIAKMFSGLASFQSNQTAVRVFQKQISVNPTKMVPALKPSEHSYKLLSFIGPRRQIDLDHWLRFRYERVKISDQLTIFPQREGTQIGDGEKCPDQFQVVLKPRVGGLLPAFPFGYNVSRYADLCPFYRLAQ